MLCLLALPGLADNAAQTNRLLIEATRLVRAGDLEPSMNGKYEPLKRAHDTLIEIMERHPSTDLAV